MKILKHRERVTEVNRYLAFRYNHPDGYTGGYDFPCDEVGNVDMTQLAEAALSNYQACLAGEIWLLAGVQYRREYRIEEKHEVDDCFPILCTGKWECVKIVNEGIRESGSTYVDPAIGECEVCSREVALSGFTNTCECGGDYNMSGQRLANRSQWGEETGEHLSDILRIK